MEATSQFSPTATITFDNMEFLNPDDLHSTASPSPAYEAGDGQHSMTQASPAPVVVHSKPAKKRKSWGQTLPEPKTMLPPRKRAKTDDEKEQRRIERIKRNRAAAHNSRERKRQETETLAVALARANAELNAYRSLHGPLPSHIVLPEVTLDNGESPIPSLVDSHDTDEAAASPASPPEDDIIKQEPLDNTFPPFPSPAFENLDAKATLSLDQTQHSAAMLWYDLQCRSRAAATPTSPASTTSTSPLSPTWWAALFLHLMTLHLQTCYKAMLMAVWSLSPSRMARLMQASARNSTSRSTTSFTTTAPLLLRSMAMARSRAATGRPALQRGAVAPLRAAALQRSSVGGEVLTARARAAAARQHSIVYQRQALGERERNEIDDGNVNEKGGV